MQDFSVGDIIKEVKVHRAQKDKIAWQQRCASSAAEVADVHRWNKQNRMDAGYISKKNAEEDPDSPDTLLEDWVIVEDPGPEELRLVPFMSAEDDNQGLGTVAKTAVLGGAAGFFFFGPISGAVIAAGTVGACAEPGSLSTAARDAARWVRCSSPQSIAECGQAYGALAGRAKGMLGEVRRLPDKLSPGLASVCSTLSGAALNERDTLIQRLQSELEASSRDSAEEKVRIEELRHVEKEWRDQTKCLSSQLEDAERACAEKRRQHRDLEAANLAKDEEVSRLAQELETTEQIWKQDTERLTRELEHHRRERIAESKRLTSELSDAAKAREAELGKLQDALAEAEMGQAAEMEAHERTENELQAAMRISEEESELKRCCVCFEDERHILFLPCRHVSCCRNCARSLDKCPIDRVTIQQKIDFIMA